MGTSTVISNSRYSHTGTCMRSAPGVIVRESVPDDGTITVRETRH